MTDHALSVNHLSIAYETGNGNVQAVSDVSFNLAPGETLGIVGESGCGKSTAAMGILQLINPPGRRTQGSIVLNGTDLTQLTDNELRAKRWVELALIPQGAMNSLNPTMSVGAQLTDVIVTHRPLLSRRAIQTLVREKLVLVGLPERTYAQYPHELSGGMKQRVCIAMAVSLEPSVIIADEATSALDVVVQRLIAQTLVDVKNRLNMSMILIGHDLGLMAQMTDRIMVMYAGKVVEIAPTKTLLAAPQHPYTQMLMESLPSITKKMPLKVAEGIMHDPRDPPPGCIFQLRCRYQQPICTTETPPNHSIRPEQAIFCHVPLTPIDDTANSRTGVSHD